MVTKFLYCKYNDLKNVIHDGAPIRFTDINYYVKLENEKIRDDESKKDYTYTPNSISLNINGSNIDFSNLSLTVPTRRAHLLCLSNDGYSPELFNHFNADTCIEINVDTLIMRIKDWFKPRCENIMIKYKDVYYYTTDSKMIHDPTESVFMKQYEKYHIENEYRVAIFYPGDDETAVIARGNIHMKLKYIEIGINDNLGMGRVIVEARRKDGSIIS